MPGQGEKEKNPERMLWEGFPSWAQFSWLYFFAIWSGLRGAILIRSNVVGWELWLLGAILLLGLVVFLRYWARYVVTSKGIHLRNGYTGRDIERMSLDRITAVEVSQGPIATFLSIGTVVIHEMATDRIIRFRGVKDPDVLAAKIRALLPSSCRRMEI